MSVGKFIAGFAIGGIVGCLIGVLLAPQSGEETREKLADKIKGLVGIGYSSKKIEESLNKINTATAV